MFVLIQYFMQHTSMVMVVCFDTSKRLFQKADKALKSTDCSSVFNFLQDQVTHVSWGYYELHSLTQKLATYKFLQL